MGGPVHSRSRSGNWQGHHQERSRQDAGRGQGKAEESHRGKRRHRLRTGQDLHRGELAGGLDGELRQSETPPIDLQNLARLSEKPHQAANWQRSAGRIDFSELTAVLQAPAGRRASRPHRSKEKAERTGTQDGAKYPPNDLLGIQSRAASSLRGVRDGRRSNAKVRVFLSLVHILDSKISYISEMADCTCIGNITFSCRTILRYIQRQDGKKPL